MSLKIKLRVMRDRNLDCKNRDKRKDVIKDE